MSPPICLVCEDEPLIAFDLETFLADSGLAVVGPFPTSSEALRWMEKGKAPDVALLDFALGDGSCVPLVRALQAQGVPVVIHSGILPDEDVPPDVRSLPWLCKPVSDAALLDTLQKAVPAASPTRTSVRGGRFVFHDACSTSNKKSEGRSLTHVLIRRLAALCPLSGEEHAKLEAAVVRTLDAYSGDDIAHGGAQNANCHLLLSGLGAPYRFLPEGRRQFTRFCFPGDLLDLDGFVGGKMDHNVVALGPCKIGVIPHQTLRDLSSAYPAIALALWRHTLADTAVFREWVVNIGQRSAPERIAHVICEVFTRLRDAGLAREVEGKRTFAWPLTQQDVADATGMTSVHVNRSLQMLRGKGLIELSRSMMTILDWDGLVHLSGFEPDYLSPVLLQGDGTAHVQM